MTNGIKIDYGQKIGKTIIFAKNHRHAEKIFEVFNKEYPHLKGFAQVIDNKINYAQSAIDEFSDPLKLPQIAISVDMLDTGIDVPEVLNLVFFKKVMSKAKFWQMIGRGTRLCPGLLDGKNKDKFYIFDFCGNFEFFRMGGKGKSANQVALQSAIFNLKFQMAFKLQDLAYQTEELTRFRKELVEDMVRKIRELDHKNFAVKQHLKYVELYANPEQYNILSYEDTLIAADELAPLIIPEEDDPKAIRFDALMYGIELALLAEKKYAVITKLKSNIPLTEEDVKNLEQILWSEVGTKEDYEKEFGQKPLGEFVREIVGLDMNAAKAAFSEYLTDVNLDARQIYFVNQIVEYIVHNGLMKDLSVLQEPPFTDKGSVAEIFTDLTVWMGIRKIIEQVNTNALVA